MPIYIYTSKQVLRIGLKVLGVDDHRQQRQSQKSNLEDFKCHYGTDPVVVAQIWEDLQTATENEIRVRASAMDNMNSGCNFKNFLRSIHFLMRYGTEGERKVVTGNSKKTVRKWTWYFLERIQALRRSKVSNRICLSRFGSTFSRSNPPCCIACRLFGLRLGRLILLSALMVFTVDSMKRNTSPSQRIRKCSPTSLMDPVWRTSWHSISGHPGSFG